MRIRPSGLARDLARARALSLSLTLTLDRASAHSGDLEPADDLALELADILNFAKASARDLVRNLAIANDLDGDLASVRDLVRDLAIARDLASVRDLANVLGRDLPSARDLANDLANDLAIAIANDLGRNREPLEREARPVALPAARLLVVVARLLPAADRARYSEEFRSELWDLAQAGAGRLRQVAYALRQLRCARLMVSALRSPRRRGVPQ